VGKLLKVCYIAPDVPVPHPLGSSTHVYELSRHLASLGHEVHIIARRVNGNQSKNEQRDGIDIYRLHRGIIFSPNKSSVSEVRKGSSLREGSEQRVAWRLYEFYLKTAFALFAGFQSARRIKQNRLDVILERDSSFGAGVIASYITSRPLFLEVIGARYTKSQLKRAKKIFAYDSSPVIESVDKAKLEIVTAAANPDLFQGNPEAGGETRRLFGIGEVPVVGYFGSFHEWHGMSELIDAAILVLKQRPTTKFFMVGPYHQLTLARVTKLGIADSFVFPGAVRYEDVPKFMSACDILVAPYNPSKFSSFDSRRKRILGSPLKLFEYMSVGKPLVSTTVKPVSAIIKDRITGLLVPPGDSHSLAGAILELIGDQDLSRRIGENARKEVVERYSWDSIAKRVSQTMQVTIAEK
jgi:glycosyltransferase involved in cell wall biosynthesis